MYLLLLFVDVLLDSSMEDILGVLKKKIRHVSASQLIETAKSIELSMETTDFLNSVEVLWHTENGVKKLGVFLKQSYDETNDKK